jgi:hypothetical protein
MVRWNKGSNSQGSAYVGLVGAGPKGRAAIGTIPAEGDEAEKAKAIVDGIRTARN